MRIDLPRCAFEGAIGAVVGVTVGAILGSPATIVVATGALFSVAWLIKDLARQALTSQFRFSDSSPKASVLKLIIEGTIPTALAVSHLAFNLFPAIVVGVVWGIFAIEASVIAANTRRARGGLFA
ncbi:MAG: hypothetical protein H0U49_02550 [Parachlamydiaceae bacterium]|nr:hypothetical protein [Parachlamydiaceae bacterium]